MGEMSKVFKDFSEQTITIKRDGVETSMTLSESNYGRIVKGSDWEKKLYATLEGVWKNVARYLMETTAEGRNTYAERADKLIKAYLDHVGLDESFARAVWTSANTRLVKSKSGDMEAKMASKNVFQKSILRLTEVAFEYDRWIDIFEIKERNGAGGKSNLKDELCKLMEQNRQIAAEMRENAELVSIFFTMLTPEQVAEAKAKMAANKVSA